MLQNARLTQFCAEMKSFRDLFPLSVLYDMRYIAFGFFLGKSVLSTVSFCRVAGGSMHPTLRESTGDIVLLWNINSIRHFLALSNKALALQKGVISAIKHNFSSGENGENNFLNSDSDHLNTSEEEEEFGGVKRSGALLHSSEACDPCSTALTRGAIYVLWHPSRRYRIIKRLRWLSGDIIHLPEFASYDIPNVQKKNHISLVSSTSTFADSEHRFDNVNNHLSGTLLSEYEDTLPNSAECYHIPSQHIWVQGDNRNTSEDSRTYGAIPFDALIGRAVAIVWPPSRFSFLPTLEI